MRTTLRAALVATAAFAAPVLALPALAEDSTGQFVTQQSQDQVRASKLVGVDVYGPDNVKIGDISEVLLNRDGTAQAVVIGVGGFLGLGQKNVAVAYKDLEWSSQPVAAPSAASNASPPATTGSVGSAGTGGAGGPAGAGTPAPAAPKTAADDATRGYPDHASVRMTKADLQNAPAFHYYGESATSSSGSGGGAATAPAGVSSPMGGASNGGAPKP
jgi:hypothetical protein